MTHFLKLDTSQLVRLYYSFLKHYYCGMEFPTNSSQIPLFCPKLIEYCLDNCISRMWQLSPLFALSSIKARHSAFKGTFNKTRLPGVMMLVVRWRRVQGQSTRTEGEGPRTRCRGVAAPARGDSDWEHWWWSTSQRSVTAETFWHRLSAPCPSPRGNVSL